MEPARRIDPITTEPWHTGNLGKAWKLPIPQSVDLRVRATIARYLIEAPWANPNWHSYCLHLAHLRPIDGDEKPRIVVPNATHQFWIAALEPDIPRQRIVDGDIPPVLILPVNFIAQLAIGAMTPTAGDDIADAFMGRTAKDICAGFLSPDIEFRRVWIKKFGDAMYERSAG